MTKKRNLPLNVPSLILEKYLSPNIYQESVRVDAGASTLSLPLNPAGFSGSGAGKNIQACPSIIDSISMVSVDIHKYHGYWDAYLKVGEH